MRIMYINDVGFDNQNGTNHLILSMLVSFLKSGYCVYYVAGHSNDNLPDIPEELKVFKNFEYDIITKKSIKKDQLVRRFLDSVWFEYKARKKWRRRIKEIDIVILQSHYTAFITSKMLKKYRKKVIFNIYDIFPGFSYESSGLPNKIIYKFFARKQNLIYKNSRVLLTLTEDTKDTLLKFNVQKEKIVIVPNWYDECRIKEIMHSDNSFIKEYDMFEDKKYIQYAGSLGVSYNFDVILNIAERFRNRQDIMFQLVGNGYKQKMIETKVNQMGLNNVQFVPWQPLERLSEVYSSCALQIVPLVSGVIYNSYPSKLLPLMACKRTAIVFTDANSHFYKEAEENKFIKCVAINDFDSAIKFIKEFFDNPQIRAEYEDNAYQYVNKKYTAEKNIKRIREVIESLMEE